MTTWRERMAGHKAVATGTFDADLAIMSDPEAHGYERVPISTPAAETDKQKAARIKTGEPAPMVEYTAIMRKERT